MSWEAGGVKVAFPVLSRISGVLLDVTMALFRRDQKPSPRCILRLGEGAAEAILCSPALRGQRHLPRAVAALMQ